MIGVLANVTRVHDRCGIDVYAELLRVWQNISFMLPNCAPVHSQQNAVTTDDSPCSKYIRTIKGYQIILEE